jgi:hypothetical protein
LDKLQYNLEKFIVNKLWQLKYKLSCYPVGCEV